ncbi:hypothetical protein G6F62_003619 [Rhizopus arrhizus]|nr:hypothetical protein G6F62_003619 [Rhizopus arrhizus]
MRLPNQIIHRSISTTQQLLYKDYYLTKGLGDSLLRINLNRPSKLIGICTSRGTRSSNEDYYSAVTIELKNSKQVLDMNKDANRAYFGIFDGHGGTVVSEWLANRLHERIESVKLDDFANVLSFLRSYRGYFRRFPIPAVFKDLVDSEGRPREGVDTTDLTIEQRLTLAFLESDTRCLKRLRGGFDDSHEDHEGSTGSVAIIEPRDKKAFWESDDYDIVIGHVGDTRILLCDANTGEVVPLTTGDHRPGNPVEIDRLRKYAGFVTTDSWGDERIMGLLATSRAFGDAKLKKYGVSAEPDIVRYKVRKHNPAAFMVLITDGITSVLSDQEVIDIVKQNNEPNRSAQKVVDTADHLHSEDNITAMVVRLKDWDDPFFSGQSLEDELLGKGYLNEVPLGSSLAAELQSATNDETAVSATIATESKLASMAVDRRPLTNDLTSPLMSPLQWSASTGLRSRRSSFSSSWSSINDPEDDDPFDVLKKQLEDLNTAVWETKTVHKRLSKTLSLDETLQGHMTFAPPFEYVIQSVINLLDRKSRDRERQTSYLRSLDSALRKETSWMPSETIKELEGILAGVKATLNDPTYSYDNPLPSLRTLTMETSTATDSLEELKELMYVNKRQVQELNSRLRSIAKTVHEVRKDMRKINKFIEEKDDEDPVILEKGEASQRVKDILWGLDDLDSESSKKLEKMKSFWENN